MRATSALLAGLTALTWGTIRSPAQPPTDGPAFEAASLKLGNTISYRSTGGPGTDSPGQWNCQGCELAVLLWQAWNLDRFQLFHPEPTFGIEYNITAKIPPGTSPADFRRMIQRLLMERVGLKVHMERRPLDPSS